MRTKRISKRRYHPRNGTKTADVNNAVAAEYRSRKKLANERHYFMCAGGTHRAKVGPLVYQLTVVKGMIDPAKVAKAVRKKISDAETTPGSVRTYISHFKKNKFL